jgi:4-hydroxybenzoate polyprenyltransferase
MSRLRAHLQLARASLALSPVADVLAGAATAQACGRTLDPTAITAAAIAGVGCFVFGMTANDVVDRAKDAVHSPHRPLPSGRVSLRAARLQASLAAVVALVAAALVSLPSLACVSAMLVGIGAYSVLPRHGGAFGVALLGAIRGLDLALGGIALGAATSTFVAAGGYALFIGAVAAFARMEDGDVAFAKSNVLRTTGAMALAAFATPLALDVLGAAPERRGVLIGLMVAFAGIAWWWNAAGPLLYTRRIDGGMLRRCVGVGLSGLFAFDAAVAFTSGAFAFGVAILIAFCVARALVRLLPPS